VRSSTIRPRLSTTASWTAVAVTPWTSRVSSSTVTVILASSPAELARYSHSLPGASGSHGLSTSSTKSAASSDGVGTTSSSTPVGGLGSDALPHPVSRRDEAAAAITSRVERDMPGIVSHGGIRLRAGYGDRGSRC
jgi:hypothetical protein